jgi:hypothetical protein
MVTITLLLTTDLSVPMVGLAHRLALSTSAPNLNSLSRSLGIPRVHSADVPRPTPTQAIMPTLTRVQHRSCSTGVSVRGTEQHAVHTAVHGRHEQHDSRDCSSRQLPKHPPFHRRTEDAPWNPSLTARLHRTGEPCALIHLRRPILFVFYQASSVFQQVNHASKCVCVNFSYISYILILILYGLAYAAATIGHDRFDTCFSRHPRASN